MCVKGEQNKNELNKWIGGRNVDVDRVHGQIEIMRFIDLNEEVTVQFGDFDVINLPSSSASYGVLFFFKRSS